MESIKNRLISLFIAALAIAAHAELANEAEAEELADFSEEIEALKTEFELGQDETHFIHISNTSDNQPLVSASGFSELKNKVLGLNEELKLDYIKKLILKEKAKFAQKKKSTKDASRLADLQEALNLTKRLEVCMKRPCPEAEEDRYSQHLGKLFDLIKRVSNNNKKVLLQAFQLLSNDKD